MADSTIPAVPAAPGGLSPYEKGLVPEGGKSFIATWLFALFLGGLGIDRFYLGKTVTGLLKLLTGGGFGIWSLVDVILVLAGRQTDKAGRPLAGYSRHRVKAVILTVAAYVAGWALLYAIGASTPAAAHTAATSPATSLPAQSAAPTASATATPTASVSAAQPSTTPAPAQPPTAAAVPATIPSAVATAGPTVAPQSARDAAAAILRKASQDYSAWFEKGAAMAPSAAKIDWYTGYAAPDQVQAMQDAFSAADKNFTADDEPASLDDWRNAATQIPGDIQTWYSSDTGQGQDPALTAKVRAEFSAVAKLAEIVKAGS